MKNRRHDSVRKLVSYGAYALSFYLLASPVTAEANWILEASALGEANDNAANTSSSTKSDTAFIASLSGGYYEQIATYTGLSATLDVESRNYSEYGDLSSISRGLSINLNHKFGVGLQAVRMNAHVSYGLNEFRDNNRSVTLFTAGVSGSSWVSNRLKIMAGYEYDKAVPVETFTSHCGGYYGAYTNCPGESYDNPYDTKGNSVFARVTFLLSDIELMAGYRYRRGDVVADYVPGAGSAYSYTPIWRDAVFPGLASARYDAQTHTVNLGVSGEIVSQLSLNMDYSYNATSTSVANYNNNVVRLGIAYAY